MNETADGIKVIIVGGVAGGASCAARLRRLDETRADPHGGARALRLVRQLRPAVLHRRRDRAAGEPARGDGRHLPRHVQRGRAHGLRGGRHRRARQDRAAQGPDDRRGEHRALRQAGAVPGRGPHPPAAARHRPARDLRREDGARRRPDPHLGRGAARHDRRSRHLHRHADAAAGAPRGRRRRRVHRHRDGGEPGGPRLRGHAAAARRPDHGPARPRDGALPGAPPRQERRARWCWARVRRRSGRRTTGRSRSSSGRTRSTPPTSSSSASA